MSFSFCVLSGIAPSRLLLSGPVILAVLKVLYDNDMLRYVKIQSIIIDIFFGLCYYNKTPLMKEAESKE